MFWVDQIVEQIVKSGIYKPYWVDDMKTPSGRVHVGALRGVVIHDLIYKALLGRGQKAKYTYVFEDHDPMDDVPSYLDRDKFEPFLGMPLFKIPSPVEGYENYARYYAADFQKVFNAIGSTPEIIWTKDLYTNGLMNPMIKDVLDNAKEVRKIYEEMYDKKLADNWYPFQLYCPNCGKVSTTQVTDWDGKLVTFECVVDKVKWAKGCGEKGKVSPFSGDGKIVGKMPWKVEWPAKWKAIGVTIEGAGKDHMSKGGSHDLASEVSKRVLNYPVPFPIPYEWILIGGRKMSSSRGVGIAASDMLEILPPELIRFLIVRIKVNTQINFDPSEPNTIANLFDDYQKAADAYFKKDGSDIARIFELSQIGDQIKHPPSVRFSVLAQWVQMPNMEPEIKKNNLEDWVTYARNWIEKYAPENEKFTVQKDIPQKAKELSDNQRKALRQIANEIDNKRSPEDFQIKIYDIGKSLGLNGKETFAAIYLSLLGKDYGPKAAWLILSLDKEFVKKRFSDV